MEENILLRVGIDQDQIDKSTKAVIESRRQIEALIKTNDDLAKEQGKTSEAYVKNESQIKALNQTLSTNQRVLVASAQILKANEGSIIQLRESVKTLNQSYINLTKAERESAKGIDLQKKIRAQTDELKNLEGALGQNQRNVGNYGQALNTLNPALGGTISGIQGATQAAKAFIATPLGAILAALAVVVGVLASAFKKSETALDAFEDITTKISTVIDVVLVRVSKLIDLFINLTKGNISLSEAVSQAGKAFDGLGKEIQQAATQSQLYLDISRDLEDSQFRFRKENAATERQIKALVIAAKNRNLTFEEQEKLLNKALELERNLVNERTELARIEALSTIKQTALKKSLRQTDEENFDAFVDRILRSGKLSKEEAEIVVSQIEQLENAKSSSLAFEEKVQNQLDAINQRRLASIEKEQLAREKLREEIEKKSGAEFLPKLEENELAKARIETDIKLRLANDLLAINKQFNDDLNAQNLASQQFKAQLDQLEVQSKLQAVADISGALAGLGESLGVNSRITKALATASATISTYLSAQQAFQAATLSPVTTVFPAYPATQAALAVIAGLANVAKINKVTVPSGGGTPKTSAAAPRRVLADGGAVDIGGNLHTQGGTTFVGSDGTSFEAERGEKLFVVNRNSSAMLNQLKAVNDYGRRNRAALRTNYLADGGFVQRASANQVQSTIQGNNIVNGLNQLKNLTVIAKVTDINRVQGQLTQAKVISTL